MEDKQLPVDLKMAGLEGDERLVATARHIAHSLGAKNEQDMLHIFSHFDRRLAHMGNNNFDTPTPNPNPNPNLNPNPHPHTHPRTHLYPSLARNSARSGSSALELDVKERLDLAERAILKWDAASLSSSLWDCAQLDETEWYLHAVDQLQDTMGRLCLRSRAGCSSNSSRRARAALRRATDVHHAAMSRLEEEFRRMLVLHSEPLDSAWLYESVRLPCYPSRRGGGGDEDEAASRSSSGEDGSHYDPPNTPTPSSIPTSLADLDVTLVLLPPDRVYSLCDIARRMLGGGYGRECCLVYTGVRKSIVEQSLYQLGLERCTAEEVHTMEWEALEEKIKKWTEVLKLAVKIVFASERQLVEDIFARQKPWQEVCFAHTTKGSMTIFLSFAEDIATSRRSPEKMFRVLSMYETLRDLHPDIASLFSGEAGASVRSETGGVLMRLGEAARATFAEFENAIQRDPAKVAMPGAPVHPLTRYVMNYIRFLVDYKDTLTQLLGDMRKDESAKADGEDANRMNRLSPLAVQIIWLIVLLECNLDAKSKLYKDLALTRLFLLNNMCYIVQKAKQPELAALLGDDWLRKHDRQVCLYASNYERAAWKKVLQCLREDDGLGGSGRSSPRGGWVARAFVKDRFRSFNAAFEEGCRVQSTLYVPDAQLREDLRESITKKLVLAYTSFLGRFRSHFKSAGQAERYIKYTPEDLEILLVTLFQGTAGASAPTPKGRFFHRSHDT